MPIDELFSRNTTRSPKDWSGPENWNLQAFMAQSQAWEAERLERRRWPGLHREMLPGGLMLK